MPVQLCYVTRNCCVSLGFFLFLYYLDASLALTWLWTWLRTCVCAARVLTTVLMSVFCKRDFLHTLNGPGLPSNELTDRILRAFLLLFFLFVLMSFMRMCGLF